MFTHSKMQRSFLPRTAMQGYERPDFKEIASEEKDRHHRDRQVMKKFSGSFEMCLD